MNQESNQEKYLVPGLIRGLKILESFTPEQPEMSLSEISTILDINRSSVFRLIQTLEHCGYLTRTPHKTYTLNIKAMQLGYTAIASITTPQHATNIMQKLRDQTEAAVHLSILDGTDIVYLNNVQALGAFTSNIHTGTRWPAYATVIGQMLLGALTNDEIRQRFTGFSEWKKYSDSTAENIEELIKKIEIARSSEFLVSWKKFKPDMIACVAPIKNKRTQSVQYGLSISCPATAYNNQEEFVAKVIPYVLSAAKEIAMLEI